MGKIQKSEYAIKNITTQQQLDAALDLEERIFDIANAQRSPQYSREKWTERMDCHSDLMLYADAGGFCVGIVFGRIESDNIVIGPVAIDKNFRGRGIARKLMLEIEKRAPNHGIFKLSLGSVKDAEGFYQKLGYTGCLLIQSEKHSIDELLAYNDKYSKYGVIKTNLHDGIVNQVFLDLTMPNRKFQRKYENALPGCHTQMVFGKILTNTKI